ncbi:MAG: hypothetical protein LBT59_06225 [Clostridiales bacterium]|nr:hypothetical protein [Clostridiales bacterium]
MQNSIGFNAALYNSNIEYCHIFSEESLFKDGCGRLMRLTDRLWSETSWFCLHGMSNGFEAFNVMIFKDKGRYQEINEFLIEGEESFLLEVYDKSLKYLQVKENAILGRLYRISHSKGLSETNRKNMINYLNRCKIEDLDYVFRNAQKTNDIEFITVAMKLLSDIFRGKKNAFEL